MPLADLLVLGFLAAVLATSAATKLRARRETEDAFVSLRIPAWVPRRKAAAALPWVELVLAAGLVVAPSAVLVPVAVAVTALMVTYTLLIGRALGFDHPVTCSCFGRLGGHHVNRMTLLRNVLLTGLSVWAVLIALREDSLISAAGALDSAGWAAVAAAVVVVVTAVLIAAGSDRPGAYGEGDLDYLRTPIPFGRLVFPDGRSETLRELAANRARLLVVLTPHCNPCLEIAEQVDGWSQRLAPAVDVVTVYPAGVDARQVVGHSPDLVAFDPDRNVRAVLGITGTPAAVLLGADGLLAGGPVGGRNNIRRLVEDVLDELPA